MSFQLVFTRRFSMAHRLISGCSEKCAIPHGHNEFVKVYIEAKNPSALDHDANMVEVFAKAKKTWHYFIDEKIDHALQLSDKDPLISFFQEYEPHRLERIVVTPGDPTTEMMCACLMSKLQAILDAEGGNLQCIKLELEETPTNTVIIEGIRAFDAHLPKGDFWWNQADESINHFSGEKPKVPSLVA